MEKEERDIEKVRRENVDLLIDIAHLCNRKDRTRVENILLLGNIGAGKCALVNTVIKAIAGKYIPKAKVGAGITHSKTFTLESYKSCGVTVEDITDTTQRDLVQGMLHRLPTILDVAGRSDDDTGDSLTELLELLIGGYIPPGTSIEYLETLQKKHNAGALKKKVYTKSQDDWKVTKVVYVQSGRERVSKDLVKCLQTVLKETDPRTAQPLYTGDIFVVITKYDLVNDQINHDSTSDQEEQYVTTEAFGRVEKEIAVAFNIQGALEDNMMRWTSYTDKVDKDNPHIDNTALKFIKRMVVPGNRKAEVVKPVITSTTKMKLEAMTWWNNQNFSLSPVLWVVIGLASGLVIALMLYLLTVPPKP